MQKNSKSLEKVFEKVTKDIEELKGEQRENFELRNGIIEDVSAKINRAIEEIMAKNTEVKVPTLDTHYTNPYMLIDKVQDIEYPPKSVQSFDNYLVGVLNCGSELCNFNFILSNGVASEFKADRELK